MSGGGYHRQQHRGRGLTFDVTRRGGGGDRRRRRRRRRVSASDANP